MTRNGAPSPNFSLPHPHHLINAPTPPYGTLPPLFQPLIPTPTYLSLSFPICSPTHKKLSSRHISFSSHTPFTNSSPPILSLPFHAIAKAQTTPQRLHNTSILHGLNNPFPFLQLHVFTLLYFYRNIQSKLIKPIGFPPQNKTSPPRTTFVNKDLSTKIQPLTPRTLSNHPFKNMELTGLNKPYSPC